MDTCSEQCKAQVPHRVFEINLNIANRDIRGMFSRFLVIFYLTSMSSVLSLSFSKLAVALALTSLTYACIN